MTMSKARYVKRLSLAVAAVVAITATGVVIGGAAGDASAEDGSDTNDLFVSASEANYDLDILESNARAKVVLPADLNLDELGTTGLQQDTITLVATVDGTSTYVALDNSNLLCIVSYIPGDDWVSGSTCTTPESFSKGGFGLRIASPSDGFEAYIIPDANTSTVKSLATSADVSIPQQNLLVIDYELPASKRAELIKQFSGQPVPIFERALSDEI